MAEIRIFTLDFGSGRAARLTFAERRLAYAENQLRLGSACILPLRKSV